MTTTEGSGGAAPTTPGGTDGEKNLVSYETHQRLLSEKKKEAEKRAAAEARLAELEAEKSARENKELEERGEFKKLLEQANERNKTLAEKLAQADEADRNRRKAAAVNAAFNGSIDSKWFKIGAVPYDEVVINPETGEIDEASVAKVAEKIRAEIPEIVRTKQGSSSPSDKMPTGYSPTAKIQYEDWLKLKGSKEKQKYKPSDIIGGP